MRLLLDANIVVWLLEQPERISTPVTSILQDPANTLFVSTASLLELTSKAASGRLTFDEESLQKIERIATWLPVEASHAWRVRSLPRLHGDPFDRILIAQTLEEEMTLVTGDHLLADYGVATILT